jgi:hypothetical protein
LRVGRSGRASIGRRALELIAVHELAEPAVVLRIEEYPRL